MNILALNLQEVIPGLSPLETLEAGAIAALFAALMAMAHGRIERSEKQVDDLVPTLKSTSEASREVSAGVREYKDLLASIVAKLSALADANAALSRDAEVMRRELEQLRRSLEVPDDDRSRRRGGD